MKNLWVFSVFLCLLCILLCINYVKNSFVLDIVIFTFLVVKHLIKRLFNHCNICLVLQKQQGGSGGYS